MINPAKQRRSGRGRLSVAPIDVDPARFLIRRIDLPMGTKGGVEVTTALT
jgi:hypothetical protein